MSKTKKHILVHAYLTTFFKAPVFTLNQFTIVSQQNFTKSTKIFTPPFILLTTATMWFLTKEVDTFCWCQEKETCFDSLKFQEISILEMCKKLWKQAFWKKSGLCQKWYTCVGSDVTHTQHTPQKWKIYYWCSNVLKACLIQNSLKIVNPTVFSFTQNLDHALFHVVLQISNGFNSKICNQILRFKTDPHRQ